MAFVTEGTVLGMFTASSDYNDAADQWTIVTLTTAGTLKKSSAATVVPLGILIDRPSSGNAGSVQISGVSKVRITTTAHAAIGYMDKLGPSTGTDGGADESTAVGRYVLGRALETLAANTTGIISILLTHQGAGSSGGAGAV